MKLFKSLFTFYLESSIHVSLAVMAFAYGTFLEYNFPFDKDVLGFVFFGTITGYNFVKYAGIAGLHHRSLAKNLKAIQLFSFLSFGFFLFFLFKVPKSVLIVSFLLGVLTLFYVVPFINKKNLRSFYGLKIFIVAIVWAGVTVIIPWYSFEDIVTTDLVLSFIQRFLWVLVLIIPFEIRDLKYDNPSLGTLPQQLGIKKTKFFGILFLVLVITLQGFKDEIIVSFTIILFLVMLITATFILLSKKNQPKNFSAFWVEGIPMYWVALLLLMEHYFSIS